MDGEVGSQRERDEVLSAFRGAPPESAKRRALHSEVIRINTPLIKTLVAQVCGHEVEAKFARRMCERTFRVFGAGTLPWDVAMNAGRVAMGKAALSFDPSLGGLPGYLKKKVFYEIQCAVREAAIVSVERGVEPVPMAYADADDSLDRLVEFDRFLDAEDDDAPPAPAPELRELAAAPRVAAAIALVVRPMELRSPMAIFVEDHCRFAPGARSAASAVRGRYRNVAAGRYGVTGWPDGEAARQGALTRALAAHGVRSTTVRVSWTPKPVEGFAGLALQNVEQEAATSARPARSREEGASLPSKARGD
jgi:hypothetical protein